MRVKKLLVCAGAVIFAFGVYIYKIPSFKINAPEQIVIEKGNGFEIDDYVSIEGKSGKVYVEYVDNIKINTEGEYSVTVNARDEKGNEVQKSILVKVR